MKVALESGFSTDGFGFRIRYNRALVHAMRNFLEPATVALAEMYPQASRVGPCKFCDSSDAERRQLLVQFRSDSIDFFYRERPDSGGYISQTHNGEAIRFFQIRADFRQQLVGRHPDGTGEPGALPHRLLDALSNCKDISGQRSQVYVDLINAAVFDLWRNIRHRGFKQP